jgi:hypothetical protein
VLEAEVLIGELLAVDGLTTSALCNGQFQCNSYDPFSRCPYVATGEVTTLEHEVGDDSVEGRTLIAKTLLAGAESPEVLSRLRNNLVVE